MGILMQHYRRATDTKAEMAELFAGDNGDHGENGHEASQANHSDNHSDEVEAGAEVNPELVALFEQFDALGNDLYGDQWQQVCRRNVSRITGGKTQKSGELTTDQIQKLITGMMKVKSKREPVAA
jgi:hypothetical protein